jgi:SAM-dependent methyltransferase
MNLYEEKKGLSLDDPRTTELHREIIQSNAFLKEMYISWYSSFKELIAQAPEGKVFEIGSGGGFSKEVIPNVITSDIQKLSYVDVCCSAEHIPMADGELSAIFMINVLHHIPDCSLFFKEAIRVLKPGGVIIMIEPAKTLVGSIIYNVLHHEPYDPSAPDWTIKGSGPLSDANIAIPWIVFKRDYAKFQQQFPELVLTKYTYHTPFRYLLSGGVSRPSFLPYSMYKMVDFAEKLNRPFASINAMFNTIVVTKN